MADPAFFAENLPPEVRKQWARMATPAHLAQTVTAEAGVEAKWEPVPHLSYINDRVVEACADPGWRFLDIEVSVRHGKSWLLSWFLPVWYLGMYPDRTVFLLAYNEDKAAEWGEATREVMKVWGPELFGQQVDTRTASRTNWKLKGRRGELVATGVGGTITGKGCSLAVIDDPIKNQEEADSPAIRKKLKEGYYSNVRTRLHPHATVVLAMARWREDDLAGEVVHGVSNETAEDEREDADRWEVIRFPALAEAPDEIAEACPVELEEDEREVWIEDAKSEWTDELGRHEGDALWPEMWPREKLEQLRATMLQNNPQAWDGLYQQRPTTRGGGEFKDDTWRYIAADQVPHSTLRKVRIWDLASTEGGGDWTVGMLVGMSPDGITYVLDVVRRRLGAAGVEDLVASTAAIDRPAVPIRIEQERAGSGKALVDGFARRLVGYDVAGIRPEGDKETRAAPVAAQQQRSRVVMVQAEWNKALKDECSAFPRGKHDDQVDCLSAGHGYLAVGGPSAMETERLTDTPLAALYGHHLDPQPLVGAGAIAAKHAAVFGRR